MSGRAVLRLLCLAVAALAGPAHAAAVWPDFPIIQWQPRTPDQLAALKRIGVTAGAVIADRDHDGAGEAPLVATLRAAGMGYYVENIATDFYAQYHRYTPGKIASWRFADAQAAYRAHPDDPALLQRQPGLSDAVAQGRIDARLEATVRRHAADHPLFYDLGDETGIADLSAYWDFDTSPASLAGMRDWLQHEYPSLEALNAEWGTHYIRWDGVQPELTGAAMRRTDDNFAPWSDFKAWMDEAFARALRRGARAVHAADPAALAGIEGAQMPGWGGWDYTRLAHTVDVMEIYDSGENLAILRALNPHVIPLATAFGDTPEALHGLWHAVLNGARGLVLWDEDDTIVHANATPGLRAAAYRPLFAALHGTFGQAMRGAVPVTDPVAILYSPVSFRVQWMLDHRPLGDAWMHRDAEMELADNAFRVALRGYAEALGRLGLQPRYLAPADLAAGRFGGAKALILPDALALSPAEVTAIGGFVRRGGRVIADTRPGLFEGHGRRLPVPASVAFRTVAPEDVAGLRQVLGMPAAVGVEAAVPVDRFVYRRGRAMLLALQTAAAEAGPVPVVVTLPAAAVVRNAVTGEAYGRVVRLALMLDPVVPTLLAVGR